MIKAVTVVNHVGAVMEMSMTDPYETGLAITNIEGLGPGEANIITTEYATNDGAVFNSSRLNTRNIVISFALLDCPTMEDTRLRLYQYFPVKKPIWLVFETEKRTVKIQGYVESNVPDIFQKRETAQVSVICPNPYFQAEEDQLTDFSGMMSEFEFDHHSSPDVYAVPYTGSFTEPGTGVDLMSLANLYLSQEINIFYEGEAETGIDINIKFNGPAGEIKIYNTVTLESMTISSDKINAFLTQAGLEEIHAGDKLLITTSKGEKKARFIRGLNQYNVINSLGKDTDWFQLQNGDNNFAYTAGTVANLAMTFSNKVLYEGI